MSSINIPQTGAAGSGTASGRLTSTTVTTYGSGSTAGPTLSGYTGSGELIVVGAFSAVTPTTGVASGTAGAGTTSTSLVKPAAAANWTTNDLKDKLLRITSGGGASGDANLPTLRAIKSNSTTALVVEAVSGMDSTTVFDIVLPNATLTGGTTTITRNTVPITLVGFTVDANTYSYGFSSTQNASVRFHGCKFATPGVSAAGYSYDDGTVQFTDCLFAGGAQISVQRAKYVSLGRLRANAASGFTIDLTPNVDATLSAESCTGNLLTVKRANNLTLTAAASSCSVTPVVLESVLRTDVVSLTGSSNTGYGLDVSKGGVFYANGATITGSLGDFIIDGLAHASVTWSASSSYGAVTRWGTTILITGGANTTQFLDTHRLEGNVDITAAGIVSGTGGTVQSGGRFINYGYFHLAADSSYDALVAHAGGGQASATALTYGANRVATVASANDSVVLPSGATIGGVPLFVYNAGANTLAVFPASGHSINALAANTAISVAAGKGMWFVSRSSGTAWDTLLGA